MSEALNAPPTRVGAVEWPSGSLPRGLLILAGFLFMYLPIYGWAARTIWHSDEQAHGPLILAVLAWLFWAIRRPLLLLSPQPNYWVGAPVFAVGLGLYLLGRLFGISILEFGSQLPVLSGVLLLVWGFGALRLAWFPIFYLIFMVPLPGFLVDAMTGPLKHWISSIVEAVLYFVGYPIARTGVMLAIGPYQLLVADACSGLNSMFSLTAVGTLYTYLIARANVWHNLLLLAAIPPVAFAANVVRVVILVLLTFHFGDEVGQGYLHGAAGVVLMLVAIAIVFVFDTILLRVFLGFKRG